MHDSDHHRQPVSEPAYPPTVRRLDALWQAWRNLPDDDPDAACAWWPARADPTMTALTHPTNGAFTGCGPSRHHRPPDLPVSRAPAGGAAAGPAAAA